MKEPSMIHVIATIELKPGTREAFLAEFRANVPNVLAETGCLEYGPTVDCPTDISAQMSPRENVVTIVEKWENLDALKEHLRAPHMLTYRERVKDFIVNVSLQILEPA